MPRLIPISKVADRCGVSEDTVRRMLSRGQLPVAVYALPSGSVRYDEAEVDAWLDACKRTNTPPCQEDIAVHSTNHQEQNQ